MTADIVSWQDSCPLVSDSADGEEKWVVVQSGSNKGKKSTASR